jgi:hypothetical protein
MRPKPDSPYNRRLSRWNFKGFGKSLLICAGFAWGVGRTLKGSGPSPDSSLESSGDESVDWDAIGLKLNEIESAVEILAAHAAARVSADPAQQPATHGEMAEAIAAAERRIEAAVDAKFEMQGLAIGGLQSMIRQTDALLVRVLTAIETEWPGPSGADWPDRSRSEWNEELQSGHENELSGGEPDLRGSEEPLTTAIRTSSG